MVSCVGYGYGAWCQSGRRRLVGRLLARLRGWLVRWWRSGWVSLLFGDKGNDGDVDWIGWVQYADDVSGIVDQAWDMCWS